MLKVASISWSFADDIIFHNPSLVLYASGCKWACPGCHNKALQCFSPPEALAYDNTDTLLKYISSQIKTNKILSNGFTIVGSGGDFYFQLEQWLDFCNKAKDQLPDAKIIWYTGAEFNKDNTLALGSGAGVINAILWGKLKVINGKVMKTVSMCDDGHSSGEFRQVSVFQSV